MTHALCAHTPVTPLEPLIMHVNNTIAIRLAIIYISRGFSTCYSYANQFSPFTLLCHANTNRPANLINNFTIS